MWTELSLLVGRLSHITFNDCRWGEREERDPSDHVCHLVNVSPFILHLLITHKLIGKIIRALLPASADDDL